MDTKKLLEDIAKRSPKAAARLAWEFQTWTKPTAILLQEGMKAQRKGEQRKARFISRVLNSRKQTQVRAA